jgi:pantoate--beta-alanine ligase
VRDLDIPVRVAGGATLREADGLALSSRNAFLSPKQRAVAPALYRALRAVADGLRGGAAAAELIPASVADLIAAGFESVDYLELRDARTLAPLDRLTAEARLLVAARLGATRLIDNIGVSPAEG